MRKIVCIVPGLLLVACATSPDYVFRNDDRPTFDRQVSAADLRTEITSDALIILDVRLEEDYAADPELIPGALYRNPETISAWSSSLPKDAKIVVYCVKGKWVSQKAASYLEDRGYDVYSLDGGIEAWQAQAELQ